MGVVVAVDGGAAELGLAQGTLHVEEGRSGYGCDDGPDGQAERGLGLLEGLRCREAGAERLEALPVERGDLDGVRDDEDEDPCAVGPAGRQDRAEAGFVPGECRRHPPRQSKLALEDERVGPEEVAVPLGVEGRGERPRLEGEPLGLGDGERPRFPDRRSRQLARAVVQEAGRLEPGVGESPEEVAQERPPPPVDRVLQLEEVVAGVELQDDGARGEAGDAARGDPGDLAGREAAHARADDPRRRPEALPEAGHPAVGVRREGVAEGEDGREA